MPSAPRSRCIPARKLSRVRHERGKPRAQAREISRAAPSHANCLLRRVRIAAVLLLLLAPSIARAADATGPAKIRLQTGSSIFGVVTDLAPGDYVVILLPHGELRTIPWTGIDMVHVRGFAPIGPGARAPPTTSWLEKTAPAAMPPGVPADTTSPPPDGRWALGVRGTVLTPTTARSTFGLGFGGEANLIHWFAPELALYGLFEHTRFNHAIDARTMMFGGGLRISSSAGTSALADVSTGFRVLSVEGDDRHWLRRGAIPFRLGAGLRIRSTDRTDFDLLLHVAPHLLPYASPAPACAAACAGRNPSPIGFVGVSLGISVGV